jgi:hypothetical protein
MYGTEKRRKTFEEAIAEKKDQHQEVLLTQIPQHR